MKDKETKEKILSIAEENKELGLLTFAYNELLSLVSQLEQEAERRGYKKGIELEQLRNAEFFEEEYRNKERLEELEAELKLLEEENGKQNER